MKTSDRSQMTPTEALWMLCCHPSGAEEADIVLAHVGEIARSEAG